MAKALRTYRHGACKRAGMSHSRISQSGFSMLEVMIAMAVMAIGISAMFSAMGMASQVSDSASGRDIALKQIEDVIEEIKPTSFVYLNGHEGWFDVPGLAAPAGRQKVMEVWAVDEALAANVNDRMRHVRLRCEWVDRSGPQFIECEYYAADSN